MPLSTVRQLLAVESDRLFGEFQLRIEANEKLIETLMAKSGALQKQNTNLKELNSRLISRQQ